MFTLALIRGILTVEIKGANMMKKGFWGRVTAVSGALVASSIILAACSSNADPLDNTKLEYSGYNKYGTPSFTSKSEDSIKQQLLKSMLKANGADKAAIEYLDQTKPEDVDLTKLDELTGKSSLVDSTEDTISHMSIKLSPDTKLSNGEKVKAHLDISKAEADKYHLSTAAHTYTVKGLKKTTVTNMNKLAKDLKFKFFGYQGFGSVEAFSKNKALYGSLQFKADGNSLLKNGETVHVTFSKQSTDSLIDQGIEFQGTRKLNVKVKGLKSLTGSTNVSELMKYNDQEAKEAYDLGRDSEYMNELSDYSSVDRIATYTWGYDPTFYDSSKLTSHTKFVNTDLPVHEAGEKPDIAQVQKDPDQFGSAGSWDGTKQLSTAGLYVATKKSDGSKEYYLRGKTGLTITNDKYDLPKEKDALDEPVWADNVSDVKFEFYSQKNSFSGRKYYSLDQAQSEIRKTDAVQLK